MGEQHEELLEFFRVVRTESNASKDPNMASKLARALRRLPTHIADIRENPKWLAMFALARIHFFRDMVWSQSPPRKLIDISDTLFRGINPDVATEALDRDGLFAGFQLPADIVSQIDSFARATHCFGNLDRRLELRVTDHGHFENSTGRSIVTGHYFERVMDCEAARRVQQDPILFQIAQNYLGGDARITATRLWWSFPAKNVQDADLHLASQGRFHFDLDDWRMVKFFFYIGAVDNASGPHIYVKGSHKRHALGHQFTLMVGQPTDEIEKIYRKESFTELTGPAGFGFVEDPFGFHMGSLAEDRTRLVLEVTFGVSPKLHRRFFGEPHPRTASR